MRPDKIFSLLVQVIILYFKKLKERHKLCLAISNSFALGPAIKQQPSFPWALIYEALSLPCQLVVSLSSRLTGPLESGYPFWAVIEVP